MATKKSVTASSVTLARATLNIVNVLAYMLENGASDNSAWYDTERKELSNVAQHFGIAPDVYLAAIAVFSPSIRWDKNKSEIERMARLIATGATWEDVRNSGFMGYGPNVRKAFLILTTGDLRYLSGPKVVPFWNNLMGNSDYVTIDRHACNIAVNGLQCGVSGDMAPTKKMFPILQMAYTNAAKIASVLYNRHYSPASIQAITWGFVSASVSNHTKGN